MTGVVMSESRYKKCQSNGRLGADYRGKVGLARVMQLV